MHPKVSYFLLSLLLLVSQSQTSVADAANTDKQPLALIHHDHPLAGRIYDVKRKQFISDRDLFEVLGQRRYILLGETHDNIRHHVNQQRVMEAIADGDVSVSVSFEMIDDTQAETLGDLNGYGIDELVHALGASTAGWDYAAYYRGLLASALDGRMTIRAGNIDKQKLIALMRAEPVELDTATRQWLSDLPLTATLAASLRQEIVDAHCGMIQFEDTEPMLMAQRLRDIAMALSLFNSPAEKRLLIAGVGHVRTDRGVPYYLRDRDPDAPLVSLGMIEVAADQQTVEQYSARWDGDRFPFDYVWFTPRADRGDPCRVFETGTA